MKLKVIIEKILKERGYFVDSPQIEKNVDIIKKFSKGSIPDQAISEKYVEAKNQALKGIKKIKVNDNIVYVSNIYNVIEDYLSSVYIDKAPTLMEKVKKIGLEKTLINEYIEDCLNRELRFDPKSSRFDGDVHVIYAFIYIFEERVDFITEVNRADAFVTGGARYWVTDHSFNRITMRDKTFLNIAELKNYIFGITIKEFSHE